MVDRNPYQRPFDDDHGFHRAHYAQKTSALAILSVISGLMSFPLMCCVIFSIPFSVFAIVSGHMARGIVRKSNGEYSGIEMATFGMIMGYATLLLMGGFLALGMISKQSVPRPVRAPQVATQGAGEVLLSQAESQLKRSEDAASGVATTEGDAKALANHFIETLNILDETHFSETNEDVENKPREYRVFAQLNEDSVAFLVAVEDLDRFTPEARETLYERCWIIAQRSVDDILLSGEKLAVAIYSESGPDHIMIGVSAKSGPADAGLNNQNGSAAELAEFFQLDERPHEVETDYLPIDSQIDNKAAEDVSLPAEIE